MNRRRGATQTPGVAARQRGTTPVPMTITLNATVIEALGFLAKLKGTSVQAECSGAIQRHLFSELEIYVSAMEEERARRRKARRAEAQASTARS